MILVHTLTEATGGDATTALDLLNAVEGHLVSVTADAAYDTVAVYETAYANPTPGPVALTARLLAAPHDDEAAGEEAPPAVAGRSPLPPWVPPFLSESPIRQQLGPTSRRRSPADARSSTCDDRPKPRSGASCSTGEPGLAARTTRGDRFGSRAGARRGAERSDAPDLDLVHQPLFVAGGARDAHQAELRRGERDELPLADMPVVAGPHGGVDDLDGLGMQVQCRPRRPNRGDVEVDILAEHQLGAPLGDVGDAHDGQARTLGDDAATSRHPPASPRRHLGGGALRGEAPPAPRARCPIRSQRSTMLRPSTSHGMTGPPCRPQDPGIG